MAVALVVISVDNTRRKKRVTYKPIFSGNYTNPGGDTLDFTAATDPNFKNAEFPQWRRSSLKSTATLAETEPKAWSELLTTTANSSSSPR
jgi:hypothetical protein